MRDTTDLIDEALDVDLDAALERTYARHEELVAARAARRRRVLGAGLAAAAIVAAVALVPALTDDEAGTLTDGVAGEASLPPPDPVTPSDQPEALLGPATDLARGSGLVVIDAEPAGVDSVEVTFGCVGVNEELVGDPTWRWSEPESSTGGTLWVDAEVFADSADCAEGAPGVTTTIGLDRPYVVGTPVESRDLP